MLHWSQPIIDVKDAKLIKYTDLPDKSPLAIYLASDTISNLFYTNRIIVLSIVPVYLGLSKVGDESHKYAVIVPNECAFAFGAR